MYKRKFSGIRHRNTQSTSLSSNANVVKQSPVKKGAEREITTSAKENVHLVKESISNVEEDSLETRLLSQKKTKNKHQKPKTYFEEIIGKCGLLLHESDDTYVLGKDQAMFVKDLELELKKNMSYPSNIDEFFIGFEKYVSNSNDLKKALNQTKTSENCHTARSMQQDSLVRLLLLTPNLQARVAKFIIEKAAEYALSAVDDMGGDLDEAGWVRLILTQLRLLDFVVEGETLASQLIELLQAAPQSVQQEVIFFMPHIVSDDQHQDVAESLSKLLHEHLSLTPAILEVLSQLNIGSILRAKVCEEMLDVLRKAPVEFLPSIVAFVLSESELADLELVTARLRTVLDLTPMPPPPSRSVALSQKFSQSASTSKGVTGAKSTQSSYVILTLEAIGTRLKVGQRGQRLVDAWVTALDAVDSANAHKTLDLLIIIVLLDLGNGAHDRPKDKARHRKTETLLKAKVRKGLFTEELLEKTFMSQSAVLREYFRTVTLISSILLSSRETALLLFGAAWLRLSIIHLAEHLRPTALGELIMHTAIGRPDTANVVLKTLHSLAHEHYEKIAPHSILLLGLLDKVEDMDIEQVRDLMDVLCFLAFSKDDHRSGLRTDITILIRKHLSSTNIQLKRKGVITSIMAVKHMASVESECDMVVRGPSLPNTRASSGGSQASEESLVPGSKAANAVMFLELVLSTCGCYAEIIGLLYDQLSCMSMDADLDEKFMEWITKTMTYDFQDSFIDETSSNFESSVDLPLSVQFALDEDLVNPIALKLTPLVSQREERLGGPRISFGGRIVDEKVERPLEVMNPLLRLMRILRFRLEDGDLSSIDALLGCGVVLPKMLEQNGSDGVPVHEEFAAIGCMEQRTFLSSIIFAINWFIELVNAFTFQKDVLLKKKVMKRVMNIVELRGILSECLPQIPGYIPPASQYLCPTPVPSFASAGKDVKKGQKRKRKRANPGSKKSKKALPNSLAVGTQDPDDNESGGEERDEDAAGKDEEDVDENPKEGIGSKVHKSEQILSLMAPFFRELDVEVFILLREEFVIGQYTAESTRRRPSELGPPELKYLLEEYTLKLEHKLPSNPLIMSSKGNAGRMSPFGLLSGKKTSVFLNLDLHESKDIALSAVSLLPSICEKLERVSEYFQDAIDGCDGILDNPQMFLGHSPILARCFHLLFKDIEIILSWNGYATMGSSGIRLLKDALSVTGGRLGAVRRPTQGTQSSMTAVQLAEESCSYFARFADWVVRLPAAVALVTLIHRATLLAESRLTQREELVKVCRTFLSREWIGIDGHPETGAGAAEHLGTIMTSFLWASCSEKKRDEWESTGSPLESLHRIIDEVALSAADLKSNADRLSAFPAITKTSFHVVFNALATWLELVVKEENIEPPARPTQTGNSQVRSTQMRATQSKFSQAVASQQAPTANIKLEWWEIVIKCIHSLVKISKIHDSRKNLSVLLKKSYSLVNLFLSNGMPVLDKAFSSHPQKVSSVLRELQTSTRYIQHLCCDCKVKKDVGLTAHVPVMKRVLDRLVFRVKEMLLKNNCAIAFWVGNLKNKNLRGEEIISQAVTRSPSLRENEESDVDNDMDADADEDVGGDEPLSDGSDQVAGPSSRKSKSKKKVVSDDDDEEDSDLPSDID